MGGCSFTPLYWLFIGVFMLDAKTVENLKDKGTYEDGQGLRLQITKTGVKSWVYRYQILGRRREMGLGRYPDVTLRQARAKAALYRSDVMEGLDPLEEKKRKEQEYSLQRQQEEAQQVTFEKVAKEYIESHRSGWKNEKHAWQWENTIERFALPFMGELSPNEITTDLVLKVLKPIWMDKTETASRLRSRIELVLDSAKAKGLMHIENPARWKGHLDKLLPQPSKVMKVRHHPAMPYEQLGDFWKEIEGQNYNSAKALMLLILTATRTSEVLNATWKEFDLDKKLWVIPAERMKTGQEHRVPLSRQAVELIAATPKIAGCDYVFAGARYGKPLSNLAMVMFMRRLGYGNKGERGDYVPHGFRSTFRDWAGEVSSYPRDVAEMALAHVISNKVEAAYRRGDMLAKRAAMMQDWADVFTAKA